MARKRRVLQRAVCHLAVRIDNSDDDDDDGDFTGECKQNTKSFMFKKKTWRLGEHQMAG